MSSREDVHVRANDGSRSWSVAPAGGHGGGHHGRSHQAEREARLRDRQALYGDFITEASRLTMGALCNLLERPDTFVKLYGMTGRIRLGATNAVLDAAELCIRQIIDLYAKPNMTADQIRLAFERDRIDPIREFSVACRKELVQIAGGG